MTDDDRRAEGMRVRREVLGDAHVDASVRNTTDFTSEFQDLITRYAWGEIWTRPGLERKTRSMLAMTTLLALGRDEEFQMHVRASVNAGVSRDELEELLLQSAIYCGIPAANHAFRLAEQALAGVTESGTPR